PTSAIPAQVASALRPAPAASSASSAAFLRNAGTCIPQPFHPSAHRAAYGALEPAGGEVLSPQELDAVVVPGLAFDRRGYRVGYGGGFFDRFLPRTRPDAFRVGICFHLQLVEEVPHGAGDEPVDAVVTEREVIRCRRPGPAGPA
ncbi:MAG TPA: 5-formyltetrahydrofolate cyclo-ligase, partial [Actinomycetota bacterium]|nr:5-formyltetrahydrofolate cyclo-ligase [Actinomycetota bacterium]